MAIFRPRGGGYGIRWETIGELGEGGQGKVFLVTDLQKRATGDDLCAAAQKAIAGLGAGIRTERIRGEAFDLFCETVLDIVNSQSAENQGALKVLHESTEGRDPERAEERIKREIEAMRSVRHPNLLAVLDSDPDERWYVSRYHPKGTLTNNLGRFKGNLLAALEAFRPLVDGVAELHKESDEQPRMVHRDIKPDNIFLTDDGNLVLGDFGIVFFADQEHTRFSATLENVGSRDWMPPWAFGRRIEDLGPTFDVFSLGKVLWSMVSGSVFLNLWYFDREEFNVEKMFPDAPGIRLVNPLLAKCITEDEEDCLDDAGALLEEVDKTLRIVQRGGEPLSNPNTPRPCRVCGFGQYEFVTDRDRERASEDFGLTPSGMNYYRIFACKECGHVQLFHFKGDSVPPAWSPQE